MARRNLLRNTRVGKVDFVDRGADEHARLMIWKRDSESSTPNPDANPAEGTRTTEEANVAVELTEEVRKGLPEDVRDYLDSLEQRIAAAEESKDAGTEAQDADSTDEADEAEVAKRDDLPEAVIKRMDALEKRAADAEAIAKREHDLRVEREWADRLAKFDGGALGEDAPATFRELEETNPDLASKVVKTMEALQEKVDTSALFSEAGHNQPAPESAEAEIEKRASALAKEKDISVEEAWGEVVKADSALYERYKQEV